MVILNFLGQWSSKPKNFLMYLFIFERERERERETSRGRGRQRIPSSLCAGSTEPDAGLELMNCEIMT